MTAMLESEFEKAIRLALSSRRRGYQLFYVGNLGVVWAKRHKGGLLLRDEPTNAQKRRLRS